jgi:ribosome recycling factor
MNKAVEVAKDDFGAIRTGRAHPSLFNKIMVDYYGTYTSLSQLASIQIPEARMALISPFDKGAMASIEKAIRESDLGVNPGSDGVVIRVNFPQLTEERRKDYIKVARTKAEDSKVSMRNIRRAAKEAIEMEKVNAMNQLKTQVANLTVDLAEKILHKKMEDRSQQEIFVNDSLKNITLN